MSETVITQAGSGFSQTSSFSTVANFLIVNLIDNFNAADIESLEMSLLQDLHQKSWLRGVLFNLNDVVSTDYHDLMRLSQLFKAIQLLGGRVGLCGISPGLASVIVAYDIDFHRGLIGSDLDDLLDHL
jgi:anti-anti-sigma regulatory factor